MKNTYQKLISSYLSLFAAFMIMTLSSATTVNASEHFVTILSPNGGERFLVGKPFAAQWNSSKNCFGTDHVSRLKLDFERTNDRGDRTINSYTVADTGSYTIAALPNMAGDDYLLRISCQNSLGLLAEDVSDRSFSISALPVISTTAIPVAKFGRLYKAEIIVTDLDQRARVSIDTKGLPDWLNNVRCQTTLVPDSGSNLGYKKYVCVYSGIPTKTGIYRLKVVADDGMGGVVTKSLRLTVGN